MQGATAYFPWEHFGVPFLCPPTLLFGIFLGSIKSRRPNSFLSLPSPFASNPTHVKYSFRFTRAQGEERRSVMFMLLGCGDSDSPCHAHAGAGDASEGSRRARSGSEFLPMLRDPPRHADIMYM